MRRRRLAERRGWLGPVAAAALLLDGGAARAELECGRLAAPITDHSCFHARFGPFKEVAATAPGAAPAGATLDAVHTYHAVALPGRGRAGALPYTPVRSGAWAFYVQHAVPLEIRDGAGRVLPVLHEDEVPGCPHLARVEVVELTAGAQVQVVLGPATATAVGVVIEKLDDFVVLYGRDGDGDGYGDGGDVVASPCLPPAGRVANDEDCDDGAAAVFPGAPELCGQPDRNCNGVDGDQGASCQLGRGACAATGMFTCGGAGSAPVCQATPAAPTAERCNGIDDDCDGVDDAVEPGLCADPLAPRCVADGRGASFCGCERDLDCGDAASGRLCWVRGAEQRCIEGCVEGFGRNSCPQGQRCTSQDPEQPGTCEVARPDDGGGCGAAAPAPSASALVLLLLALGTRRRRRTR
jgi:uncharacterized protein (TIGR03382 family)